MTPLAKRPLFAGGPEVSRLCLGTMMFGAQSDEAASADMLGRFIDAGGNFIDTADTYAGGRSEEIIGRNLGSARDSVVLATKVGNVVEGVEGSGGLSPEWIAKAAEMSLNRLRTDAIDLYYLHADDNRTPLDEMIGALGELLSAGKIRHWGFSNFRPWKIAEMVRVADRLGIARPVAAQPYYHLLNRTSEADTLPACRHFGLGVVPYSPLGRGILTGKYRSGTPEDSRAARSDKRFMETEFYPETLARAAEMADHADEKGIAPMAFAINWLLANQIVSSVLIGPKTSDQLDAYLEAPAAPFTAADEEFLSGLCASGLTPAPGHTDPRYPLDGREVAL